jgi:drug/metabolite transporter (DMT)-like permease
METVFAALAAFLVLGERLTAIGWLGAVLILLATLLLQVGAAMGLRPGRTAGSVAPPDR